MKQTLKIAIPVVVLMAVIFGITFFAQYRPRDEEDPTGPGGPGGEPPLRFFTGARKWSPDPFASLQDRAFPGFYEVQANAVGTPNGASFWFENRNPEAVLLQLRGVSCNSCSGGRVAPVPPDVARQILEMTAVSAIPTGFYSGLPVGLAGAAGHLDRLEWQSHTFKDDPKAEYRVPGAADPAGWTPQWGILDLRFSVGAVGHKSLAAEFALQVEGTKRTGGARFNIDFEGVDAFSLSETDINFPELGETSDPLKYTVIVYSSTRGPNGTGPGDLAPPSAVVQMPTGVLGDAGPFVSVGPPVRLPDADLAALAARSPKPIRVEAAYTLAVTVSPKVGDAKADLGPLERDVHVTCGADTTTKTVRVRGRVRGGVWLDDNRKDVDLRYNFTNGAEQRVTVLTERKDAELVLVPDPATPDFLQLKVERFPADKIPPGTDRGYHQLTVVVPPGKKAGSWSGSVVLEAKGPNPQRIRVPVRGTGG